MRHLRCSQTGWSGAARSLLLATRIEKFDNMCLLTFAGEALRFIFSEEQNAEEGVGTY